MKATRLQAIALVVILLLCTGSGWAQFTTASLGGTVIDSSGAAIPGAKVTIQSTDSGLIKSVSSGTDGDYLFPALPVGHYRLTVEKPGFETYVQIGIVLTVNQAASQPVTLRVGAVSQEVTVSGNASLVTTTDATEGQLVTQKSIVDLPLDGRTAQSLVFLGPGSVDSTNLYCTEGCEGGVYPGEQWAAVNGGGANGVNYQLDGVDNNDVYLNANLPFPNPDAVQEFNVQTGNMSAEYGNAASGVVNIVTKSGTNQFHGDAFEFIRDGAWNARNFFAPTTDNLKRNQFGGIFGGPLKKDKLFFFGTYQGTRIVTTPQGQIAFVPTAAERNGDFSALLPGTQLINPVTGIAYQNNQIPVDPVTQFFLKAIPLPNGSGSELNYPGPPANNNDDQFLIKIDYLRGKHQISGRYFFSNFVEPAPVSSTDLLSLSTNGNQLRVQTLSINDTYSYSPTLLFNTWFGMSQKNGGTISSAPFGPTAAGIMIAAPPSPELSVYVGGYFDIESNHIAIFNDGDQVVRETVTWVKGRHELHFGGEALRIRTPDGNPYEEAGYFQFANSLSGDDLADFMLGRASGFQQSGGIYMNLTGIKWSAFVQDNWRVNPRLTLQGGLRWDPYFPYKDSKNRMPCFIPGKQSVRYPNAPSGLLLAGDPGCPLGSTYSNLSNIAPRVGFAYKLTQDGKTSLRGGAGFYYMPPETVTMEDLVAVAPFAPTFSFTDVDFANPYGSAGIVDPFPAEFGPNVPPSNTPFTLPVTIGDVMPLHYKMAVMQTWSLMLQRQLANGWLLSAAYFGNKASHIQASDNQGGQPDINAPVYIAGASTEANTQSRRPYPNFGPVFLMDSALNSNYNSLQMTLEKRLSHGLSLLTNYTWSKTMNDVANRGSSSTDPLSAAFDYGPANWQATNIIKLSGTWQIPWRSSAGVSGRFLSGWELAPILTSQSGFPFSVFSGLDNSFSAIGNDRANFLGTSISQARLNTGRPHGQLISEYFNTSLFGPNTIGTFGNTGKNILYGPGLFDVDLGLLKTTRITERTSIQFRAEFFNFGNNVNFGKPTANLQDPADGQITSAGNPRVLQFALKLFF